MKADYCRLSLCIRMLYKTNYKNCIVYAGLNSHCIIHETLIKFLCFNDRPLKIILEHSS